MTDIVLDSSVIIALIADEPISADRSSLLEDVNPVISAVNLAEVSSWLADQGADRDQIVEGLGAFGLTVMPLEFESAVATGLLRPLTRHMGLSLGDRACLALARSLGAPVLTADRAWAAVNLDVEIRLVR